MATIDEIATKISSFNIANNIKERCELFWRRIDKAFPDVIEQFNIENLSLSFSNEILSEWIIGNYYLQVRTRENEITLEAKTPQGRQTRVHPLPLKMVNATKYCLDMINGKNIHS